MKKIISLVALLFSACQAIPYEDDKGFTVSSQANSQEFLVFVNETVCKDAEGKVGACAIRVPSNQPIRFRHDPRPYAYTLIVRCSPGVNSSFRVDVPANHVQRWVIMPERFSEVRYFTCTGEVIPLDRGNQEISASWHVRPIVVDAAYKPREQIHAITRSGKEYLVLGKYARLSTVCRPGERCGWHERATLVEAPPGSQAYSESLLMRINYYGF